MKCVRFVSEGPDLLMALSPAPSSTLLFYFFNPHGLRRELKSAGNGYAVHVLIVWSFGMPVGSRIYSTSTNRQKHTSDNEAAIAGHFLHLGARRSSAQHFLLFTREGRNNRKKENVKLLCSALLFFTYVYLCCCVAGWSLGVVTGGLIGLAMESGLFHGSEGQTAVTTPV